MIKLYTDTNFLNETYRKKVFPLLFDIHFLKNKQLLNYYNIVDRVDDCNIIVIPIDYVSFLKFKEAFSKLQKASKTYNKPIWIYTAGDYGFTNYIKNSYTFRLGGFKSKLPEHTFILPSFVNDPYSNQLTNHFSTVKKEDCPTIGFVGHAQSGLKKYLKELVNHLKFRFKQKLNMLLADAQPFYPSSIKRAQYLELLQKSKLLKTDFILRKKYRAGAQNEDLKLQSSQEFYKNIFNNAYTFCSRGVGNFSVRFYEVLAVGRIPILLNTNCKLPLEDAINWNNHIITLDLNSKTPIDEQILNFHKNISDDSFETIQKNNRLLWETHLRRPEYFIKIHDIFVSKMNANE